MKDFFINIITFLKIDIWKIKNVKGYKLIFYRWIKIIIIIIKEIKKDDIALKTSSLTYFSMLSIVPIFAVIFGIAKAFGFEVDLKKELARLFEGQEVVMTQTFLYAQKMLDGVQGGLIAVISIVFLIYTVMRLLNSIEDAFNSIWNGLSARTWVRKITDYLAIIIIAPLLITLSSGITVFIATQIRTISQKVERLEVIKPIILSLLNFAPYFVIWLLFSLIYIIMPNTKVNLKSGVFAGIIAGTIFQMLQWGFINFQIGVARNNAIYGSLAALPLFLIFTQMSWTIVFIGGKLSYAIQTVNTYIPDDKKMEISINQKRKIGLLATHYVVKNFEKGNIPLTKDDISEKLQIPIRFINNIINQLTSSGVLIESTITQKSEVVYLPSIDINKLDFNYVFNKLNNAGEERFCLKVKDNFILNKINTSLHKLNLDIEKSSFNRLLKDIEL